MSARDKINGMCALGIIAFASLLGTASQSWNMFLVTAGVLGGIFIISGDIRLRLNKRRRR